MWVSTVLVQLQAAFKSEEVRRKEQKPNQISRKRIEFNSNKMYVTSLTLNLWVLKILQKITQCLKFICLNLEITVTSVSALRKTNT